MSKYENIANIIARIRGLESELQVELRRLAGIEEQPKNSVAAAPMPAPAARRNRELKLVEWLEANITNSGIGHAELMAGYRKASGRSGQSAGQQLRRLVDERIVSYDRVSGIVKLR